MKMAFIVCNSYFNDRVMKLLAGNGIDYYTRWDNAMGKGHGTEPHLGAGSLAIIITAFVLANDPAPRCGSVPCPLPFALSQLV